MMKCITILVVLFLMAMTCIAACTEPSVGDTTPTMSPTPTETTAVPTTPAEDSVISGLPPSNKAVEVQVNRDPIFTDIAVIFRGGKGQYFVQEIDVRATLSDGTIINEKLGSNVNDEIVIQGTTGEDRIEVFVSYLDGTRYKIYDEYHKFKQR
jgi:hypothetical protein